MKARIEYLQLMLMLLRWPRVFVKVSSKIKFDSNCISAITAPTLLTMLFCGYMLPGLSKEAPACLSPGSATVRDVDLSTKLSTEWC